MTRIRTLAVMAGTLALAGAGIAPAVANGGPCVGGPGCYRTVQAAVDAARAGDTIRIGPGTFAGGVHVTTSLHLVGAGRGRTMIRGGGPVLTVGTPDSGARPQVSLADLTVTGGVTHGDGLDAFGGGIYVPPAPDGSLGASLALERVAVTGNRTSPTRTIPSPVGTPCPDGDCPFAASFGAGIWSVGALRLDHSSVSGNLATGMASDVDGAGIFMAAAAPLTLTSSVVDGNRAAPERIGRFAEGGGILTNSGDVTILDSRITGNRAELVTRWPTAPQGHLLEMTAHAGGLQTGDGAQVRIERTTFSGNSARVDDPVGEPLGFDSAFLVQDSHLVMRDSVVSANTVEATVATSTDVGPAGSAVELDGPAEITGTRITGNPVSVLSPDGEAGATSGLAVYDFVGDPRLVTLRDVLISGNSSLARSPRGSAAAYGGGIFTNSLLTVRDSTVRANTVTAQAPVTRSQGGGIWNGPFISGPPVELTLIGSSVTGNAARTSGPGAGEGGGLYTTLPVTLTRSSVTDNRPDDCAGCAAAPATAQRSKTPLSRARPSTGAVTPASSARGRARSGELDPAGAATALARANS